MNLPDKKTLWLKTLQIMEGNVGESRVNDPADIKAILAVEGLPFEYGPGDYVAFCAATIAKCACKALALLTNTPFTEANSVQVFQSMLPILRAHYYNPSASVSEVVTDAKARGIFLEGETAKNEGKALPGYLVCYTWPDGGHHIGMIRAANSDILSTVEGNTEINGVSGIIAYKERDWSCVWGVVQTYIA